MEHMCTWESEQPKGKDGPSWHLCRLLSPFCVTCTSDLPVTGHVPLATRETVAEDVSSSMRF